MRNKSLLLIFTVLVFATLIILVCSAVFSVRNINIISEGKTETETYTENQVREFLNGFKGKNIFTQKKEEIEEKLIARFPYMKVIGIEKKFPSILEIKITKRQEVFYTYPAYDGKYYILDTDLKVLRIEEALPSNDNLIRIYFTGGNSTAKFENIALYDFLNAGNFGFTITTPSFANESGYQYLTAAANAIECLTLNGYEDTKVISLMREIRFTVALNDGAYFSLQTRSGAYIRIHFRSGGIYEPENEQALRKLYQKVMTGINIYNESEDKTSGKTITVDENNVNNDIQVIVK